jgi:cysteine/O-acetylserine efflux protein
VGAAYMGFLAWQVLRSGRQHQDVASAGPNSFRFGLGMQFVNPKLALYGITVMSSFVLPLRPSPPALLGISVLLGIVGLIATLSWAACGAVFQRLLCRHHRSFSIAMALVLLYCAAAVLLG